MNTPLITGSDCEGAGEMFQVTTLDMNQIPRDQEGKIDYSEDFFGKMTNLTVSGQLDGETLPRHSGKFIPSDQLSVPRIPTLHAMRRNSEMIEPEVAFADLEDNMELAEAMLKSISSGM